jgi:hypothetical protein
MPVRGPGIWGTRIEHPLFFGYGEEPPNPIVSPVPCVDLKAYGAVDDGATDNAATIQAALATAALVGGWVVVPPAVSSYRLNSSVTAPTTGYVGLVLLPGATFSGAGSMPNANTHLGIIDLRGSTATLDLEAKTNAGGIRSVTNGGGTALSGVVNSGQGIAVSGSSVATTAAILGVSSGYYAGHFINITDLGSSLLNANNIGLVSQSVYAQAAYFQQGAVSGSGSTLARTNILPAAYITRVVGNLNGNDYSAPLLLVEDTTIATGELAEYKRANGEAITWGAVSENLTLSTSGATTDTSANLLPANAIIESVVARVYTTIATATDWKLGDATIAGRFSAANATLVAGTQQIGLVHVDQAGTSGPRQTAAAKVRVTTTGTPSAGAIRITVFYRRFTAPTS